MFHILVAEDDERQRRLICAFLRMNGYQPHGACDGVAALEVLRETQIDLAVCDVMMPRMDGYELTRELRLYDKRLPILIVTAKGELSDKQLGFLAGADDYMVKPVDLDELLLRVRALLRRASMQSEHCVRIGNTCMNDEDWTITVNGERMTLPRKEFALLFMLLSYPDKLLTRRQLMDAVWGVDCDTDERTVDVHIKRLREKLRGCPDVEIETVRGLGYRAREKAHA